ncbi:single-stranded DNA-binding protein [Frankia sp. AgKG'84/4]|uniref:single-stranded DNA-binding protein n=1 Tax=Frankia sp. AgKG'84/4 TaxID=573490 RepID=UPI00200F508D|nr:single-stranded DNA-binding protein [Frankia sp. AgKG'84/4]MCL9794039.1 single-stranded DNA-binding protein [Frankia sp. AgKG'84/4]
MLDTIITLVGNLVDDPEHRTTANGASVCSFRLASTPRRFDRAENRWVDGTTLFLRVSCWRQLADNVAASLGRGDRALVYGRLRQRSFETSEGERRVTYEIDADAVGAELTWHAAHSERLARRPAGPSSMPVEPAGPAGAGPLVDIDASTTGGLSAPEPVGAVTVGGATRLANVLVGQAPQAGPTGNATAEELLPIGAASLASVSAGEGRHG